MKVGLVVWSLDLSGGAERQVLELGIELQKLGHHVEIYCANLDADRCFPSLIAKFRSVHSLHRYPGEADTTLGKIHRYWRMFTYESRRLANLISSDLDIINCHSYTSFWVGVFFKSRTGKPVVGMLNDLPNVHGFDDFRQHPLYFPLSWAKRKLFAPAMRQMDKIVLLAEFNRPRLRRLFGLEAVVFPSGLDLTRFPSKVKTLRGQPLRILSIGNFTPWRRHEDLVCALKMLVDQGEDCELHLVGSHALTQGYFKKIRALVARLQLDYRVHFHGVVREEELLEIYSRSDFFVFPNYPQILGLVVYEAMASGTPVVVSDGYGTANVLRDGETALLVPAGSPEAIASALRRLSHDPELYKKLSINGRIFVENNIGWNRYATNMLHAYQEALGPCC